MTRDELVAEVARWIDNQFSTGVGDIEAPVIIARIGSACMGVCRDVGPCRIGNTVADECADAVATLTQPSSDEGGGR